MKALRIAFFYPSRSMRIPVDVSNIWTSPRGLTGSEVAFFKYAMELSRLGHGVTIFTSLTRIGDLEKITCVHYNEWRSTYCHQPWDALVSWMTPEPLEPPVPESAFKIFNQQVSDFGHCAAGWERWVDVLAPLTHSHARFLRPMTALPAPQWRVMYNGVDTSEFKPEEKTPGKMVWASSHDRGLHWLLEVFPRIKARVPSAELHIFYDFNGMESFASVPDADQNSLMRELGSRSRYCMEAIERLSGRGVHAHRSVSRQRIRSEMASASVLAYPCDPVRYTETFGVTVLEACASGTVPVICASDCFGELWAGVSPHVPPPYASHKQEYEDILVDVLTNDDRRRSLASECVDYAKKFEWADLGKSFEEFIVTRGAKGLPEVSW